MDRRSLCQLNLRDTPSNSDDLIVSYSFESAKVTSG